MLTLQWWCGIFNWLLPNSARNADTNWKLIVESLIMQIASSQKRLGATMSKIAGIKWCLILILTAKSSMKVKLDVVPNAADEFWEVTNRSHLVTPAGSLSSVHCYFHQAIWELYCDWIAYCRISVLFWYIMSGFNSLARLFGPGIGMIISERAIIQRCRWGSMHWHWYPTIAIIYGPTEMPFVTLPPQFVHAQCPGPREGGEKDVGQM